MRTVVLVHPSAGGYGADRQLLLLATGLPRERYRPVVVLGERGPLSRRLERAGVHVEVAALPVLRRRLLRGRGIAAATRLHAHAVRELGALARACDAAVVHSNTTTVLCGQAVADRAGARHVQHVREIYRGIGGPAGAALWPLFERRLARADALVCVSRAAAAQFGDSARCQVLYDAVPRTMVLPPRALARRSFGIEEGRYAIALVGRVSDWKGQTVLLRALAEPPLARLGAVALIAGDAAPDQRHFERELPALLRRLGIEDRVRLLGFREDVETVLAAADAVALPATHPDSLPNAALEAAAAGVPIVATSVGGQSEVVHDGVDGRLVPPGDPAALARAFGDLAADPAHAAALAAAAASGARARFARHRLLRGMEALYDQVCEGRPAVVPLPPAAAAPSLAPRPLAPLVLTAEAPPPA